MPTISLIQNSSTGAEASATSTGAQATIRMPLRRFPENSVNVRVLFSSGSSCTWKVQGKSDGANDDWCDILTPSADASGGFECTAWPYMRMNITAISGTTVYAYLVLPE